MDGEEVLGDDNQLLLLTPFSHDAFPMTLAVD